MHWQQGLPQARTLIKAHILYCHLAYFNLAHIRLFIIQYLIFFLESVPEPCMSSFLFLSDIINFYRMSSRSKLSLRMRVISELYTIVSRSAEVITYARTQAPPSFRHSLHSLASESHWVRDYAAKAGRSLGKSRFQTAFFAPTGEIAVNQSAKLWTRN